MTPISIRTERALIQGEPLAAVIFEPESARTDVLIVHGFTGSKEDFTDVATLLAQSGFRVLTFDNRGQHESAHSAREDGYSIESLGRDAIEIAQHFKLSKPHILGHSFGGLITQQAVRFAPDYWSSFTLFCSGPGGQSSWLDDPQFKNLTNETKVEIWEEFIAPARIGLPNFELRKKRWIASDATSTMIYRDYLLNQPSYIKEISQFQIPAHVVYGENDDAWPLVDQDQMASDLSATLTVLPNCGHCPNDENPPLTAEALAKFWNSMNSAFEGANS